MNEKLVTFIRANQEVYTREALNKHLLNQGYSQEDIDEAWVAIEAEQASLNPPAAQVDNTRQGSVWTMGKYWWTALGFFLGIPVVIGIIGRIVRAISINSADGFFLSLLFSSILVIGVILAGIITTVNLWDKNRAVSRGLLFGLIVFIMPPFISVFIMGGICLAG